MMIFKKDKFKWQTQLLLIVPKKALSPDYVTLPCEAE